MPHKFRNIDGIENAHWRKIRKERQLQLEMGNENFATVKVSGREKKKENGKNEWQHRGLKKRWRWKKNSEKRDAIKTRSGCIRGRGWNVKPKLAWCRGTYHSAQEA